MARKFTREERRSIADAVKLAKPSADVIDPKSLTVFIETLLQNFVEKYPDLGFPDAHKKKHQRTQLMEVLKSASDLMSALIGLDDECLGLMAQSLAQRPASSQLLNKDTDPEAMSNIVLPHIGGRIMWVVRDLGHAAVKAIPKAGSPSRWRGDFHTKDYFIFTFAPIWEIANPTNKVSGYLDGDFSKFLQQLYSVAYSNDETGLDRAIKRYVRDLRSEKKGTQVRRKKQK